MEALVKKHCNEAFDSTKEEFPCAICDTCRFSLTHIEKGASNRVINKMPNYQDIVLLKETRNKADCKCFICLTASASSHPKFQQGRGNKKVEKIINSSNGMYAGATAMKDIIMESNNVIEKKMIVLCNTCKAEYGPGKNHTCSINAAPENILKIVKKLPPRQQEQITSNLLQSQVKESKAEANIACFRGYPARVIVNAKHPNKPHFDVENLDNFQTETGSASNFMKKMCNFIRTGAGKQAIPKYYREHSSDRSKLLEDIYKSKIEYFHIDSNDEQEERAVIWAYSREILEKIIEIRKFQEGVQVKVMADGGQGFLKMCITVIPKNDKTSQEKEIPKEGFDNVSQGKRSLYSEGGTSGKKALLTGGNRVIMLCCVPEVKESYENMKILFELTQLNKIPYKFVADFKLTLVVNGLQTATASYPSPVCYVSLRSLREKNLIAKVTEGGTNSDITDLRISTDCVRLRTFGDIRSDYKKCYTSYYIVPIQTLTIQRC